MTTGKTIFDNFIGVTLGASFTHSFHLFLFFTKLFSLNITYLKLSGLILLAFWFAPLWQSLKLIWTDSTFGGKDFWAWVKQAFGWTLEVVKKKEGQKGFEVLPRRWVVERTFSWFGRYRRLSKEYEYFPTTSETMLYIAMVNIMVRRLA